MKFVPSLILFLVGMAGLGSVRAESIWIAAGGGVYRSELDDRTGELSAPVLACGYGSGSFLAIHPDLDILYSSYQEEGKSGYASLRPAEAGGQFELQSLQFVPTGAAHLAVSSDGRFLAGAHWGGKANYVFELEADGSISDRVEELVQEGSGPGKPQNQARPHWVGFAKGDTLLHSVDLGSDEIWTYEVGRSASEIALKHTVKFPPGTGPRHMAMGRDSGYAYVSGELNLAVNTFFYDGESGRFSPLQYVPTVDVAVAAGGNSLSEIQAHANGRFVYTAVRGLNLIVAFSVDPDTGLLALVERQDAGVDWPRNFTVSDSGKWLVVAGQRSDEVRVFAIDPDTGALEPVESRIELQNPVCVRAWGRL